MHTFVSTVDTNITPHTGQSHICVRITHRFMFMHEAHAIYRPSFGYEIVPPTKHSASFEPEMFVPKYNLLYNPTVTFAQDTDHVELIQAIMSNHLAMVNKCPHPR